MQNKGEIQEIRSHGIKGTVEKESILNEFQEHGYRTIFKYIHKHSHQT